MLIALSVIAVVALVCIPLTVILVSKQISNIAAQNTGSLIALAEKSVEAQVRHEAAMAAQGNRAWEIQDELIVRFATVCGVYMTSQNQTKQLLDDQAQALSEDRPPVEVDDEESAQRWNQIYREQADNAHNLGDVYDDEDLEEITQDVFMQEMELELADNENGNS